jgi:hypothetical protein
MESYKIDRSSPYFTIKYFPKSIQELTTNENKVRQLTSWLDYYKQNALKFRNISKKKARIEIMDNLDEEDTTDLDLSTNISTNISNKSKNTLNDKSCIIVTGAHGVGKSAFVYTILEQKNYDIQVINFEKINQMKNINEFIEKTMKGVDIYASIINKKATKERAIVIDNIEIVSSPNEKLFISSILKQNEIEWNYPIIFICNNKHNKIINFIKKASYEIELYPPTVETLLDVVSRICLNEKMVFTGEDMYRELIEHSRRDLRLLVTNLQSIKEIFNKKVFGPEQLSEFIQISKVKDQDLGIFEATRKLMYSYENIDDVIRIFETEKTIIPLMIQHHYVNFLSNKNFSLIKEISNSLSKGDVIENYIYEHNIYDIRDTQAFHQCVKPSYILSNCFNPKKMHPDKLATKILGFPLDLNKTSIKHINYTKNILPSNLYFKNMKLDDYIYLNKVIKGLLQTENYNKINELMQGYNIDINGIESVLKINKLNGEKFIISTKVKKCLTKNCVNITDNNIKTVQKSKKIKNKKAKK